MVTQLTVIKTTPSETRTTVERENKTVNTLFNTITETLCAFAQGVFYFLYNTMLNY